MLSAKATQQPFVLASLRVVFLLLKYGYLMCSCSAAAHTHEGSVLRARQTCVYRILVRGYEGVRARIIVCGACRCAEFPNRYCVAMFRLR